MAELTREQEMINTLSLENAELRRMYTDLAEEFHGLAHRTFLYVRRLDNPVEGSKLTAEVLLPSLRMKARCALGTLDDIETKHPDLYPYG